MKKERERGNGPRRRRRASQESDHGETVDWARGARSPGPHRTGSRTVANRQVKHIGAPPLTPANEIHEDQGNFDAFDVLAAQHPDASPNFKRSATAPIRAIEKLSPIPKTSKRSSKTAAMASSNDIDNVIAQFREQCDIHMATLLELKNNITTTEKAVVVDSEKDKEFQQVRQWYSALAEKHTKLQKEHQQLQEEHVKLQEKYMNLKRATSLNDSFMAHFSDEKDIKKREKKDKGKLEVVWSRAGKMYVDKLSEMVMYL